MLHPDFPRKSGFKIGRIVGEGNLPWFSEMLGFVKFDDKTRLRYEKIRVNIPDPDKLREAPVILKSGVNR
jgi:hypothetical protein